MLTLTESVEQYLVVISVSRQFLVNITNKTG